MKEVMVQGEQILEITIEKMVGHQIMPCNEGTSSTYLGEATTQHTEPGRSAASP